MSRGVRLAHTKLDRLVRSSEVSKAPVLEHLDGICASPFFISSKRCQQFLRYVVLETLEGRGERIKERNIAHEVFGKGSNFEPGEYSLVRVKAGELRKRLSDYYESAPEHDLRIELPVGSYVPRIHNFNAPPPPVDPDVATESSTARTIDRRRFGSLAGGDTWGPGSSEPCAALSMEDHTIGSTMASGLCHQGAFAHLHPRDARAEWRPDGMGRNRACGDAATCGGLSDGASLSLSLAIRRRADVLRVERAARPAAWGLRCGLDAPHDQRPALCANPY